MKAIWKGFRLTGKSLLAFTTTNITFCFLQTSLFVASMLAGPVNAFHYIGMVNLCVLHASLHVALVGFYANVLRGGGRISRDNVLRYLVFFPFAHLVPLGLLCVALCFGTFARRICSLCYVLSLTAVFLHVPFVAYATAFWLKLYQLLRMKTNRSVMVTPDALEEIGGE